jgi:antitoxin component YwqK of YwqJK toxin-antitoxin module
MKSLFTFIIVTIGLISVGCKDSNSNQSEDTIDKKELTFSLGDVIQFFEDGIPYTGKVASYYDDNKLESTFYLKDGRYYGWYTSYYPNGYIKEKIFYPSSKEEKEQIREIYYYENGQLKSVKFWGKNIWNEYYETGQIEAKGHIKNGRKDDYWEYYYPDGTLESFKIYRSGLQTDSSYSYYANGDLKVKAYYSMNLKHGTFEFYDSLSGELLGLQIFEEGELIETIVK